MAIQTAQQYIDAYTKTFGLERVHDVDQLVYNSSHSCPVCGKKPQLWGDVREVDVSGMGFGRKTKMLAAGVIMCGCGRSSMYYDERRDGPQGTEVLPAKENLLTVDAAANALIRTWNGSRS